MECRSPSRGGRQRSRDPLIRELPRQPRGRQRLRRERQRRLRETRAPHLQPRRRLARRRAVRRRQLARLAGHRVSFLTGLCLYDASTDTTRLDLVPYHVTFRGLKGQQIERYLRAEQPYNCAGSFKSEGLGISLFESMQGEDPNALIGLPLIRLVSWLNEAGIAVP